MTDAPTVRAPRGSELSCRGWAQEAALRMLMNNLDPDVAEDPAQLVVYGGTGRAARSWEAYHAIVATLRRLADDETLLVQSGKPVGVFRTHPWAPRVLLANSLLVPEWADWDTFRALEAQGLTMYGQMTAGVDRTSLPWSERSWIASAEVTQLCSKSRGGDRSLPNFSSARGSRLCKQIHLAYDRHDKHANAPPHQNTSPMRELKESTYIPASSFSMAEREDPGGNRARDAEDKQEKPRLSIWQLREAAQRENLAKSEPKRP